MPNWCSNELTVSGPTDKVADILATIGDGEDFLSSFLPPPPELLEHPFAVFDAVLAEKLRRLYGAPDLRSWNIAAWGVKGDVILEDLENDVAAGRADASLRCSFDSPWEPPLTALDTIAERHPELTFELFFSEENLDFSGDAVWAGGERVSLKEGPFVTWCERCASRTPSAAMFPPVGGVTPCMRCLLNDEMIIVDVSMVVRAESKATLASICATITDAATVEGLLDVPPDILLYRILDPLRAKARQDYLPVVNHKDIPADSELHRLAFHTEYTPGGDLLVTYPSVYGDDGEAVWHLVSIDHPDATFQLTVTPRVNMGPDVFTSTLVGGDLITN